MGGFVAHRWDRGTGTALCFASNACTPLYRALPDPSYCTYSVDPRVVHLCINSSYLQEEVNGLSLVSTANSVPNSE